VDDEAIKTFVYNYFQSHYKKKEDEDEEVKAPEFNTLKYFVMDTTCEPEDILYQLLMSILDEKTEVIEAYLPKIVTEIISQPKWSVTKGVSRFIKDISDMAADSLGLVAWFFNLVL
jgi:hypothetical protein